MERDSDGVVVLAPGRVEALGLVQQQPQHTSGRLADDQVLVTVPIEVDGTHGERVDPCAALERWCERRVATVEQKLHRLTVQIDHDQIAKAIAVEIAEGQVPWVALVADRTGEAAGGVPAQDGCAAEMADPHREIDVSIAVLGRASDRELARTLAVLGPRPALAGGIARSNSSAGCQAAS